jgi:hypothetical protein
VSLYRAGRAGILKAALRYMGENTILVPNDIVAAVEVSFLVSHLVFLRPFNESVTLSFCYSGCMVASGEWHVGISVVEGCQTNRLLILLVLHILVLHPFFLVVQSEKRDGTMTSDAESVCCVSGEGIDMGYVLWQPSWSPTTSIPHGRKENGENEKTTKNEVENLAPTLTAQPTGCWNEQ